MATLTYTNLQNILNMTVTAATCEEIMDHAINLLNTYGAGLSNMTGVAGAKTWTGTSAQAGAVLEVACQVYNSKYVTSGGQSSSLSVGSLSQSSSVSTGSASPETVARELARQLMGMSFKVA